ncbi:Uu.00g045100.m01.CDS01 [Anthostomella pinea]|uniref:Uu.00g045100.m01.CDS01 n=1 Tax=Anthostomella pinea TaxID=933095 RepID=A0AAI8VBS5_9PEZI|nr:Uu.00g045100.m01.CDS01 [Anthostomella pinea]
MSTEVTIHTTPPPALINLLRSHHLPPALPLLRRLHFTRFPGGITPHARILFASSSATPLTDDMPAGARFVAGYLDLSRGPETELWLYSSMEHRGAAAADGGGNEGGGNEGNEGEEDQARECTAHATSLLREVKRQRDSYVFAGNAREGTTGTVLLGTLSERLRLALVRYAGVVFPYRLELYDKWVFRVDELPEVRSPAAVLVLVGDGSGEGESGIGMRWDRVRREDLPLVLSRTHINRKERTVRLLPSTAIYLNDGTPVAWAFLGPDSSLSSLHCEEPYRGRGLAKAVAVKVLQDHLKDYDDEGYGWADVATDNSQSQGVCKSLGGKVMWQVSWSRIDLDRSFPDQ